MNEVRFVTVETAPPGVGEMMTVEADGTTVAIANTNDRLYAFDDDCTHRACALSGGELTRRTVVCPCHQSGFDLRTGEPLSGPAREPIRIREVRVEGDTLLVEA